MKEMSCLICRILNIIKNGLNIGKIKTRKSKLILFLLKKTDPYKNMSNKK